MATRECGCWEGLWMGVVPPPRCPRHSVDWPELGDMFSGFGRRRRPEPAPQEPWTTITTTTIPIPAPAVPDQLTADEALAAAIKAAHTEAGKAEAAGDAGAFDAWQLAIDALRHARAAVERARPAEQAKP